MAINLKMFRKAGFEGIWRPESKRLDIYEIDSGNTPYFLRSKDFTNSRVAESYFMDKVGLLPSKARSLVEGAVVDPYESV